MERTFGSDRERSVKRGAAWEKFKQFLQARNQGINIEQVLNKGPLKKETVISYGVIEIVVRQDSVFYHMYRRRNTLEYDILIKGFAPKNQLFDLICLLSRDERERIMANSWSAIWDDYWIDHDSGGYSSLKAQSQRRFDEIKELVALIDIDVPCKIQTRPFIFPKGRPDKNESGLEAALRESKEETKNSFETGHLVFDSPLVQNYIGSDGRRYTDYYYVWQQDELYASPTQKLANIRYYRPDENRHVLGTRSSDCLVLSDGTDTLDSPAGFEGTGSANRGTTILPNKFRVISGLKVDGNQCSESRLIREEKTRLRSVTISHELETDIWIEIPVFQSVAEQIEWENSIDPYRELGIFKRHFAAILDIHRRVA